MPNLDTHDMLGQFIGFGKIARLSRTVTITEKIDGTNAAIQITPDGRFLCQSRKRLITPEDDNFGFARWAHDNAEELMKLGEGIHFGEWWGSGIQRGYGLTKGEKRFSLFNVHRWSDDTVRPKCCHVVPVLDTYTFDTGRIERVMSNLKIDGSKAAPGFMNPEGIIIYHHASRDYFKKTYEGDETGKGE